MGDRYNRYEELGRLGQRRWSGAMYEEFLKELSGAKGMAIYKEMINNDDVISAVTKTIELLARQASFYVKPASDQDKDKKCAEFVQSCIDDLNNSFTNVISEMLSFISYGWAWHEIVYKMRRGASRDPRQNSKFDDGLIGWRKLPIRSQDSLFQWIVEDDTDDVVALNQHPPPSYNECIIPIEKSIHLISTSIKENPEGKSIWRGAYRAWYFKKRIQEIEGIGVERDLAGLPFIRTPESFDWSASIGDDAIPEVKQLIDNATDIVQNIRRDSAEGVVLPFGWELTLLSTGGSRQFDTNSIIERYDSRIAMVGLADFILLGHQNVGSFALASSKTNMFSIALGTYLNIITQAMNTQAIPRLVDLNSNTFSDITAYPTLEHSDVETPDLAELGTFIKDMVGVGVLIPGQALEKYLRQAAKLPEETEETENKPTPNANTEPDKPKDKPKEKQK